ncbi:hypothetical protein VPH35_047406 [Triticum aestivum]
MADSARARSTRLHQGLPEETVIWEILVRLPPKALLRCRDVCRAWRHATSTRKFLLAHHGCQPTVPLPSERKYIYCGDRQYQNITTFDNWAADAQVQHVARVQLDDTIRLDASCDGFLLFTDKTGACFSICNPATREHARLSMLSSFVPLGMYQHRPTGEYRILMYLKNCNPENDDFYIFALGSVQKPRSIGRSTEKGTFHGEAVLLHGSLHWHIEKHESNIIMVLDTIAESFRKMCAPVVPDHAEICGILGMSNFNGDEKIIDLWMMQDYESEVWALIYRVELPVACISQCEVWKIVDSWSVVVDSCDGDVLVLVRCEKWLRHFDIRLMANYHRKGLRLSQHRLNQTLVPHTFFPTLDGYSVKRWPFI